MTTHATRHPSVGTSAPAHVTHGPLGGTNAHRDHRRHRPRRHWSLAPLGPRRARRVHRLPRRGQGEGEGGRASGEAAAGLRCQGLVGPLLGSVADELRHRLATDRSCALHPLIEVWVESKASHGTIVSPRSHMYHTRLTTSEDPYPRVLSARAEDRGIAQHRRLPSGLRGSRNRARLPPSERAGMCCERSPVFGQLTMDGFAKSELSITRSVLERGFTSAM